MANSRQSRKRARQAEKRRQHNTSRRSEMRTYLKQVLSAIEAGNKQLAAEVYRKACSSLDVLASKGQIHKNKAARHKSRLNAHINKLG